MVRCRVHEKEWEAVEGSKVKSEIEFHSFVMDDSS